MTLVVFTSSGRRRQRFDLRVARAEGTLKSGFQAVKGPFAMAPAALSSGCLFVRDSLVLSCYDLTAK